MYVCKGCGKTVVWIWALILIEHFYCNECSYESAVCKEKFYRYAAHRNLYRSGEQRGIITCPAGAGWRMQKLYDLMEIAFHRCQSLLL